MSQNSHHKKNNTYIASTGYGVPLWAPFSEPCLGRSYMMRSCIQEKTVYLINRKFFFFFSNHCYQSFTNEFCPFSLEMVTSGSVSFKELRGNAKLKLTKPCSSYTWSNIDYGCILCRSLGMGVQIELGGFLQITC